MNPFGDGSSGALNVASGTTNLLLNTKYQYTTVNIASGATLSTNSTTGAVLYICATDSITIDGTVDVSNKVINGNNSWSVTLDGITYTSPGVTQGGSGGYFTGQTVAAQSNGFGGGGSGGSTNWSGYGAIYGGNGGAGGSSGIAGGNSVSRVVSTNQALHTSGNNGANSGGGSGVAYASFTTVSGTVTGITESGNSGNGASSYGQNGNNATNGSSSVTGGGGSYNTGMYAGGGGGGGGQAGKAGIHVVLKSPTIIINGIVITSGTNGGNGGNGGRDTVNEAPGSYYGNGGGGGGGGFGGSILLVYAGLLDTSLATFTRSGGSRGLGGKGGLNQNVAASNGINGSAGSLTTTQVKPVADFSADVTSGPRPLTVNFTNLSKGADSYLWDFGDTNTSTSANPTHIYTSVGSYSVTLTATNEVGDTILLKTAYITTTIQTYPREAKGTILLGGGATRTLKSYREAKGNILIGGQANGFIRRDTDALEAKSILYKVYDEDGTYIEVWKDVISEPNFSQEINSVGSTMVIELARNSDSLGVDTGPLLTEAGTTITTQDGFPILASIDTRNQVGPGSSVNHNNRVDVYAFYGAVEPLLTEAGEEILTEAGDVILATIGAPNGLRIFTGFISDFSTRYGDTESTIVELSSYGWDLDQYPITNDDGDTKVAFNSYDPSDIAREAVDKFVEDANADGLSYDFYTMRNATSISTTGTVVSYTFNNNTYADVLQKVIELMPSNWYYYIGLGDNTVYYRERSSEATHTFFLGKHIKTLDLRSSIGDSTNRVIFTGGEVTPGVALFNSYTDTPAPRTRRRLEQNSDGRVTLDSSADILSNGVIDSKNKIQYRTTIEILSKQYDIESINVGDMIGFRNFGNYVDTLLLQVVARTYTPDIGTYQLQSITPSINKRLEDLKRQLKVQENLETPDAPS